MEEEKKKCEKSEENENNGGKNEALNDEANNCNKEDSSSMLQFNSSKLGMVVRTHNTLAINEVIILFHIRHYRLIPLSGKNSIGHFLSTYCIKNSTRKKYD